MKKFCAVIVLVAMSSLAAAAPTAAYSPTANYAIDVASMPLPDALKKLAAVTGMRVTARSSDVAGLASHEVKGEMTAKQALSLMLTGTGLDYGFSPVSGEVAINSARYVQPLRSVPASVPARRDDEMVVRRKP